MPFQDSFEFRDFKRFNSDLFKMALDVVESKAKHLTLLTIQYYCLNYLFMVFQILILFGLNLI